MTLFNDSKLLCRRFNMILNLKYNYEKVLIQNPQYFGNRTFTERM